MKRRFQILGVALALTAAVSAVWPAGAAGAAATILKPNDPFYSRQWYLKRIGAPAAWKTTQGKGVTVAVVDTGVDFRHPDLKGHLLKGYDPIGKDNDPTDTQGHGTSVSGIIAAVTNNKVGVAGVAPKSKILPFRSCSVVGERACYDTEGADAIMRAADAGAQVINLSLGGLVPALMDVAVAYATARSALVVVSAGNEALPFCESPGNNPTVLCVGASDKLDGLAKFEAKPGESPGGSNYGVRLDVVAPGKNLWTTGRAGQYTDFSGTSGAAPVVSGIGALLISMGATNIQAAQIIRLTAKDLGLPGYDLTYGFGRVDAKAAVDLCAQICVGG
jgi:thermitase